MFLPSAHGREREGRRDERRWRCFGRKSNHLLAALFSFGTQDNLIEFNQPVHSHPAGAGKDTKDTKDTVNGPHFLAPLGLIAMMPSRFFNL